VWIVRTWLIEIDRMPQRSSNLITAGSVGASLISSPHLRQQHRDQR
jgi:hypothetical protein